MEQELAEGPDNSLRCCLDRLRLDGARSAPFLMVSRGEGVDGAESARIVLNRFEELERLVPTYN